MSKRQALRKNTKHNRVYLIGCFHKFFLIIFDIVRVIFALFGLSELTIFDFLFGESEGHKIPSVQIIVFERQKIFNYREK